MSNFFTSVIDAYVPYIPTQVPKKSALSFAATVGIHLLLGTAAKVAVLGGAIAAAATVIEAMTRPITRSICSDYPLLAKCIQVLTPPFLALSLAAAFTPWIGLTCKASALFIPFVTPFITWIIFNEGFYERNVATIQIV